jgi:hydrogenase nickel incorporation protein HypA/HybF
VVDQEEARFQGTQLIVNEIPILIECTACGKNSAVANYRFVCAHCGLPSAKVVQGNELLIERVGLKSP